MKKALLYGLFLIAASASAQDVNLNVEYPSVVANGQQFSITFSVNAGGGEFSVPPFTGFYKIMGPQTSYNQSTRIIGGKITRETLYTYVYYLQATKEGKFAIPPAVFTLKDKEYRSDSMHIEVVADPSQVQGAAGNNDEVENPEAGPSRELFVNLNLSRKEVFVGEPVLATVKLFTKVDLQGINEIKYPSFNNFLRTDIETPPLTSLQQENVNGSVYGTGIIQRFLLYPQIAGEITIDPVQITVLAQQRSGPSDPFFGDFFSSYQTVPRSIASRPAVVRVKKLPGTKPEGFSGVVGRIDMNATMGQDSVNVNDAVNFKVIISGTGNLKIASTPDLKLSSDIEVYDPKISEELKNSAAGTSGSKTFEYLLIPRHHGDFTVPSIAYSYFNTSSGRYETLRTDEFTFYAKKAADQTGGITVFSGISKEDIQYLGKDIRFIKSEYGRFLKAGNILSSKRSFYAAYGFAFVAFLVILFVRRENVRRNADLSIVRNRKAGKVAGKRLHSASLCLRNQQIVKFYGEIQKAIWGYLSDKLNIPVSELTRNNAVSALKARGVKDDRIESLSNILDTCEYIIYAPSASGTEAEKVYEGASQFIRSVENSIR